MGRTGRETAGFIDRVHIGMVVLMLVAIAAGDGKAQEPKIASKANYARPFEPPTRPALLALPPGAVEPEGWLRDWCILARDGYTGNMDKYDPEFQRAWAVDHKMTGERLDWPKGAWPYEGGGYWFDGLARLGYALHDDVLLQQAKRRLDAVVTHMNPDGILFLWWLNRNNPDDVKAASTVGAWSIWASGLFGRALAAHYAGSGDAQALKALETAYSGTGDWLRMQPSNAWPALETYTWTGNKQIAAALTAFFSEGAGSTDGKPPLWDRYRRMPDETAGAEVSDHGVVFNESTVSWVLGYLWTGNRQFLAASLAWHDRVARDSMQPHGVIVADEYYGPTGAFRGTETCDVAGYLWGQIVLLAITGEGRLADRVERAFFNAGPATVSRDFRTHVYFQSPNRIVDNSPPYPHGPRAEGNSYKPTHYPLCCTAALNRILPNYVMHMWMATYDNGLAATHYGPCKVTALVADRMPLELACQTDYPFEDSIRIDVQPQREATFPLSFRIPGWCHNPELSVNGVGIKATVDAKGFVRVERLWKPGDAIHLRFPMTASVTTGRDLNAGAAPYATVSYGPLLFALPIADTQGSNTPDPAARWNYALDVQAKEFAGGIGVDRRPMPAKWDWPLASPLTLRLNAVPIDWKPTPDAPRLPAETAASDGPPEEITLVPYGCTKFRIAMFPVTERAWRLAEAQGRQQQQK